jgi:hypothetical protein
MKQCTISATGRQEYITEVVFELGPEGAFTFEGEEQREHYICNRDTGQLYKQEA